MKLMNPNFYHCKISVCKCEHRNGRWWCKYCFTCTKCLKKLIMPFQKQLEEVAFLKRSIFCSNRLCISTLECHSANWSVCRLHQCQFIPTSQKIFSPTCLNIVEVTYSTVQVYNSTTTHNWIIFYTSNVFRWTHWVT